MLKSSRSFAAFCAITCSPRFGQLSRFNILSLRFSSRFSKSWNAFFLRGASRRIFVLRPTRLQELIRLLYLPEVTYRAHRAPVAAVLRDQAQQTECLDAGLDVLFHPTSSFN